MYGLSEAEINQVISRNVLGHLGCHAGDITYVIPICYAFDGVDIYGRTYEGLKLEILRKNPNVCFQIETILSMNRWKSVICWGTFEELTAEEKRNKGIQILKNRISGSVESQGLHHSKFWPYSTPDERGIIFRIALGKKTGRSSDSENLW